MEKQGRKHYPHPPCRFRGRAVDVDSAGGLKSRDRVILAESVDL